MMVGLITLRPNSELCQVFHAIRMNRGGTEDFITSSSHLLLLIYTFWILVALLVPLL